MKRVLSEGSQQLFLSGFLSAKIAEELAKIATHGIPKWANAMVGRAHRRMLPSASSGIVRYALLRSTIYKGELLGPTSRI
jgi:hypothetical protein